MNINLHHKSKKVLLINPAKKDSFQVTRIHMGLTLLGGMLIDANHDVRILDYAFLNGKFTKIPAPVPELKDVISDFKPDVIGISVFSYLYNEVGQMLSEISGLTDAVVMLGGPPFAVFPDDFIQNPAVDYIFQGEAELLLTKTVETAEKNNPPVIIQCPRPEPGDIPRICIDIAYGASFLTDYQIQLSRGCPFSCSFCNIHMVGGRKVRKRLIEDCVAEIVEAKNLHPSIGNISITDDCPTADKKRFKEFLKQFIKAKTGCTLSVDNMRADLIDEELLDLFVKARGQNVCLGTESGCPDVFKRVNKGLEIQDVIDTAGKVREHGLILGACFVIGLPGDSSARHEDSIALAKELSPDYLFWNMCVPWPGTEIGNWYKDNGHIADMRNFSTLIDPYVNFSDPVCWTDSFTKEERIRAWLKANLETHLWFNAEKCMGKLQNICKKYSLEASLAQFLRRLYPEK